MYIDKERHTMIKVKLELGAIFTHKGSQYKVIKIEPSLVTVQALNTQDAPKQIKASNPLYTKLFYTEAELQELAEEAERVFNPAYAQPAKITIEQAEENYNPAPLPTEDIVATQHQVEAPEASPKAYLDEQGAMVLPLRRERTKSKLDGTPVDYTYQVQPKYDYDFTREKANGKVCRWKEYLPLISTELTEDLQINQLFRDKSLSKLDLFAKLTQKAIQGYTYAGIIIFAYLNKKELNFTRDTLISRYIINPVTAKRPFHFKPVAHTLKVLQALVSKGHGNLTEQDLLILDTIIPEDTIQRNLTLQMLHAEGQTDNCYSLIGVKREYMEAFLNLLTEGGR